MSPAAPELVRTLSPEQLHTLRHMLGINTPDSRIPEPHRDYAAVNPGDPEFVELERLGAVRCYRRRGEASNAYDWYCCTEAGREAAMHSHRLIRRPKKQRVYAKFLDISDVLPDLTFKQFLTDETFRRARAEA
jgi:ectoine hydroxylase-related dioxygenase (phytanoyl-CoA dioxygenase family)